MIEIVVFLPQVKADPSSESTRRLQAAGAEVIRSTDNLVRAARNAISTEEERSLVLNRRMVGGIAQEIDARYRRTHHTPHTPRPLPHTTHNLTDRSPLSLVPSQLTTALHPLSHSQLTIPPIKEHTFARSQLPTVFLIINPPLPTPPSNNSRFSINCLYKSNKITLQKRS